MFLNKIKRQEFRLIRIKQKYKMLFQIEDLRGELLAPCKKLSRNKQRLIKEKLSKAIKKDLKQINLICTYLIDNDSGFATLAFENVKYLKDIHIKIHAAKPNRGYGSLGVSSYVGQLDNHGNITLIANKKRTSFLNYTRQTPYKWAGTINCIGNLDLETELEDSNLIGMKIPLSFSLTFGYKGRAELLATKESKQYFGTSYPTKLSGRLEDNQSKEFDMFLSNKKILLDRIREFRSSLINKG